MKNVREKDLKLFMDLSGEPPPATPDDMSLRILVPAFMISELKRAFEIGFLLFLPFLIIDLVVASVLMSMGMMMLPPVGGVAAVQADLLRAGRRLVAGGGQPGAELRRLIVWADAASVAYAGYDLRHNSAFSRQLSPEFCKFIPPPKREGAAQNAHEHTGSAEAVRPSLRNGLTAYLRALPGETIAFLSPSPPGSVSFSRT